MAFLSRGKVVTLTGSTVYACPAAKEAVVHALYLSNVDGINEASVVIELYDSSEAQYFTIGLNIPIPSESTLILDKPINLEPNDFIKITSSLNNDVHAVASILEQDIV